MAPNEAGSVPPISEARAEGGAHTSATNGPLVSVLLPVRDAASFLEEALDSLRAQTLGRFEIVAVDDGSRDGSLELLEAAAREDGRVVVLARPAAGIVSALEAARAVARAPLLARMDADDVAPPDRLERQVRRMEAEPALTLCGTAVRYFPRDLLKEGRVRYEAWLNSLTTHDEIVRDLFVECPLAHPTFLMRADAVDAVGGYREGPWPEDYDLVLRLWEAGARFARVEGDALAWRDHPARLSRVDQNYWIDGFRRLKADVVARTWLDGGRPLVIWGAGPTGKAFSRTFAERGFDRVAFVEVDPAKIGQTIHDAPVVAPDGLEAYRGAFCVAAVSGPEGRSDVRSALARADWIEGEDFVAVA